MKSKMAVYYIQRLREINSHQLELDADIVFSGATPENASLDNF